MKLLFKQRFFSWLDSYDIYNEYGEMVYRVEGKLSWGHNLHILDTTNHHVGTLKQVMLTFLPKFEIYTYGQLIGSLSKKFSFFKPVYIIDFNGWQVHGNYLEWDYEIVNQNGQLIATINKELLKLTDTYVIDVNNPDDALYALMVVLAIDAEKCSRN